MQELSRRKNRSNQNRFISLSEGVISCVAHPLYNAIVAGTKVCELENSVIFVFCLNLCFKIKEASFMNSLSDNISNRFFISAS